MTQVNYRTCLNRMENFRVFVHHDNTISARVLLNGLKIQLMKEYEAHYFIISY